MLDEYAVVVCFFCRIVCGQDLEDTVRELARQTTALANEVRPEFFFVLFFASAQCSSCVVDGVMS